MRTGPGVEVAATAAAAAAAAAEDERLPDAVAFDPEAPFAGDADIDWVGKQARYKGESWPPASKATGSEMKSWASPTITSANRGDERTDAPFAAEAPRAACAAWTQLSRCP